MSREQRRLMLLKRSGLFQSRIYGVEISRASTLADIEQAFRLVHDIFLESGYINPYPSGMRIRPYEACPETSTFIAKASGRVVAAISVILDSPDMKLPSDGAFGPELDALRAEGLKLCEATNQAIAPLYRKTAVATELMRCVAAQNWLEKHNRVIAAVSPPHQSFYELLGFEKKSDVRSYSDEVHDPVIMMALDMDRLRQRDPSLDVVQSYIRDFLAFSSPFVRKVAEWQPPARRAFLNKELLHTLFVARSNLLGRCTDEDRQAIRARWGERLYAEVVNGSFTDLGEYKPTNTPPVVKNNPLRGLIERAHKQSRS